MAARLQGPTIYTVAEAAGVSIASVSRVMQGSRTVSPKTTAKVMDAAARLNYLPLAAARSLAVRNHEAHGLVLPALTGPYYSELLMGFEARAAELGKSIMLILISDRRDLGQAVRGLASRVEGIAVHSSTGLPAELVATLGSVKPIVVIAGDPMPGTEAIGAENAGSARELTAHLMGHGLRRLLFLGAPGTAPDVRDRYEGFRLAHTERGLPAPEPELSRFDEADGVRFAEQFLAGRYDADGIVCGNDELALSIMDHLIRHGVRVPDDLAIVGWDDVMAARYVRPGLTTVRQPVRMIGELAATRLHQRVAGAAPAEQPVVLPTQLVIRSSCGCPDHRPGSGPGSDPSPAGHRAPAVPDSRALSPRRE